MTIAFRLICSPQRNTIVVPANRNTNMNIPGNCSILGLYIARYMMIPNIYKYTCVRIGDRWGSGGQSISFYI